MLLLFAAGFFVGSTPHAIAAEGDFAWPSLSREQRPWVYWWWMASAVDETNISRELTRYRDAGLGGVHIIPIYGAKGWETNFIPYLTPRWMRMLHYTCAEAERLGLGVDMTTGSGWCFGGPRITDEQANASVVVKRDDIAQGGHFAGAYDRAKTQALMAFGPGGKTVNLLPLLTEDGSIDWAAEDGSWQVYAVTQKPSGQKVKRAGPGGEGHMLNLFYPPAMTNFLAWFDEAFAGYTGPRPRAQYHDSYEYKSDWAPDLFDQFEKRRGYRLQEELPALFGNARDERTARVKSDYRQTLSELMSEVTLPLWAKWSADHGFLTRNEAHGSPGNLLDLYAIADIPETEMFHSDRNKLISKFASSAAHVTGRRLVSAETGTWLDEHFTETLAEMKYLLDDLFLSGVNHVFYHGACYSPDEAAWPGWVFYASFEMNPRNSIWSDVPALNSYAARCQAVLQAGKPDADILVYWPIFDRWSDPQGLVQPFTIHARDWFETQPIGTVSSWLWERGYQFDCVSDNQIRTARSERGEIILPGASYRTLIVPRCQLMPETTLSNLLALVKQGATVLFQDELPTDVPGFGNLESRRARFQELLQEARDLQRPATLRSGRIAVGDLAALLPRHRVPREKLFDHAGLMCIRRELEDGRFYFIANRGEQSVEGWVPLSSETRSALLMDPLTGKMGVATARQTGADTGDVYLQLAPGQSIIVRVFAHRAVVGEAWSYSTPSGPPIALTGTWTVDFLKGGPELPATFKSERLGSWTDIGGTNASLQSFAGTARYALRFDAPAEVSGESWLDLGRVAQSARVRLNGEPLGTLIAPPYRVRVTHLQPRNNLLEIDVTNVSANRIRDLDRRGVKWKNFYDINVVNIDYRPFNASEWPVSDSGLLGPVTLTALKKTEPAP